jgi:hypothetical protein
MKWIACVVVAAGLQAPLSATAHESSCVSRSAFQDARLAWKLEGMTRSGIGQRFGYDGKQVRLKNATMTRSYRACRGADVFVSYRHFPQAPGAAKAWWVIKMDRR